MEPLPNYRNLAGLLSRKSVQLVAEFTFQVDIGWLSAVAPLDRLLIFVTVYLLAFVYVCDGRALVLVCVYPSPQFISELASLAGEVIGS